MTRITRIIILIALILLLPTAVAEGSRLLTVDPGDYIANMLACGDALYVVGDRTLYSWRPGDGDFTRWDRTTLSLSEDGEEGEGGAFFEPDYYAVSLFAQGGRLRGLRTVCDEEGLSGLRLCDVRLTDAGTLQAENVRALAVPEALRALEGCSVNSVCAAGEGIALLCDVESGMVLALLDPEDPRASRMVDLPGWDYTLIPSAEGVLLAERDYENERTALWRVGPDGSLAELCRLPMYVDSLAGEADTGRLYALRDGCARPVDVATGELGEAFGAVPLMGFRAAALEGGRGYAVAMQTSVAVLDPSARLEEGSLLKVMGFSSDEWMDTAVLKYAVEHPEAAPVMMDGDESGALDAMLTQSPDVDVYIMGSRYGASYDAMLERGYMLPLDGSEALSALSARMYPGVQARTCRDGAPVALPVMLYGSGMGLSEALLEKLGLSIDGVPRDWHGFIDYLEEEIRPRLGLLGEKDHFTYEMTAESFRRALRDRALSDFVHASDAAGRLPDYGDARLAGLLERLEKIDFTEYGLESREDEEYGYSYGGADYLVQLDVPYTDPEADGYTRGTPLLLGYGDDLPGVLSLDMYAAFVNPYSPHAEAAVAFLETLADALPPTTQYMLCPDLNEPLEDPRADWWLARYREELEAARKQVEEAAPADRQAMEEGLRQAEENYERYTAEGIWLIGREWLDWYRSVADRLYVTRPDWFERDTSGEAWDLLNRYDAGLISAREFLAAVDRKARMMAMEG